MTRKTHNVTDSNPTGVRSFDHREIARLPEYAAASEALDRLTHAIRRAGVDIGGQAEWLDVVTDMATALPYSDSCPNCERTITERVTPAPAPFVTEVDKGWLAGTYLCPRCDRVWNCGYAVDLAGLFE
jgi:hypothetical protein